MVCHMNVLWFLEVAFGGNALSQSSQLAEPLWTDPCIKCGISVHKLISTLKKKNAGGE